MKSVLAAITTCKRKPEMVERAIKSVAAQTYTDWDLVVVDDSPADYEFRDDVRKMVEGWSRRDSRIRYVAHDKNYGAQRARNTALNIACNCGVGGYEFIAYLDDDDEWLPEKLEKQIAKFNECSIDTGMLYCNGLICKDRNMSGEYLASNSKEGRLYSELLCGNFIGTFTGPMMRTEVIKSLDGFDELMPAHQDYEMWIRIAEHSYLAFISEVLFIKHDDSDRESITKDLSRYVTARERILKKHENYLLGHKEVYRLALYNFSKLCARAGEWDKCFNALKKALVLQPSKCMITMKKYLKYVMKKNTPKFLDILLNIKRKLKGDRT